jgi:hypothetical protein
VTARDANGNPFFLVVYRDQDAATAVLIPLIKTLDGSTVERVGQGIYRIPAFDAVRVTSDDCHAP